MPTRRKLLAATGAALLIAGTGIAGIELARAPSRALLPWDTAGEGFTDPRLRALSYAILAPNPHNRQPWRVELRGADRLVLHADLDRRLPATDPFDRQITIGLGCFLELLRLAAARDGIRAEITPFALGEPFPRLDERPVAAVRFVPSRVAPDPLFDAVPDRRSNKEPFDTDRAVPPDMLERLRAAAKARLAGTVDRGRIEALRDLTWRAHMIEAETRPAFMESVDLMRIGRREIDANPDGIDIGGTVPEVLHRLGLLTRASIADPTSTAYAQGLDMYRSLIHSAMGYVWLTTPANTRRDQLRAGAAWLRLNLAATGIGLDVHPLSQALQEYPEMRPLYDDAHRQLTYGGGTVQMLARIGYGPAVPPSPRWPIETRLVAA